MTKNILQALGLPPAFGATLLGFALILTLAPYLGGTDFGLFKVPAFSARNLKRLRVLGPLALAVAIALHVPFLSIHSPSPNANGHSATTATTTESKEPTMPPSNRKDFPTLTMTTTVYPDEECQPKSDFGIRTMSTISIGMNNQSDRDIVLTSVELVPEWITGSFWAGPTKLSKKYTVILDDWYELASVARIPSYDPSQHAQLVADGRIKDDRDWYFGQETISWVKPKPILVKEIPADVLTVKRGDQERFQISLGLSDSTHFLYGTVRLIIRTDDGRQLDESESLKFSICNRDSDNRP